MQFRGTYTAMVTPFRGGAIDTDAYRALLELQRRAGVNGVVPCGSTGEAATMTVEERRRLLTLTLDTVGDHLQVIPGTGTNSTETTIALTQDAEAAGAHAAMIVAPYYNKPTQQGLLDHFSRVADATELPLVIYNVPGRTAVTIHANTIRLLHETGRFAALKEAGGSLDAMSDIRASSDITILCGDDSLTVPMMSLGATGVVSVVSNLYPGTVKDMVERALAGDFAGAAEIHFKLLPIVRAAFIESNPAPIKAMLALEGIIANGDVRGPLAPLGEESFNRIRSVLDRYAAAGTV